MTVLGALERTPGSTAANLTTTSRPFDSNGDTR